MATPDSANKLDTVLFQVLDAAEKLSAQTVALPAFGTGNKIKLTNLPCDKV